MNWEKDSIVIHKSENGNRLVELHALQPDVRDISMICGSGSRKKHDRVSLYGPEIEQLAAALLEPLPGQQESIALLAAETAILVIRASASFKAGNVLAGAASAQLAEEKLAALLSAVAEALERVEQIDGAAAAPAAQEGGHE